MPIAAGTSPDFTLSPRPPPGCPMSRFRQSRPKNTVRFFPLATSVCTTSGDVTRASALLRTSTPTSLASVSTARLQEAWAQKEKILTSPVIWNSETRPTASSSRVRRHWRHRCPLRVRHRQG
jgi:hypothetical protein